MALRKLYTFPEIVNKIKTKIGELTSITDFTPGNVITSIIEAYSAFIEYLQLQVQLAYNSFFVSSAKGNDLKKRVKDFGMIPKEDQPAKGIITFIKNTTNISSFDISAGTTVSTQPDVFGTTIDYTLDSVVTFPVGATSVTGNITCTITGTQGNVASGSITNMSSSIPGVDSINNYSALTDGSSAENEDQIRARLPLVIKSYAKGNKDAVTSAIFEVPGITFVKLLRNSPSPGYNTAYVSNESGILSASQIQAVTDAIESTISWGINYSVVVPKIVYVTISLDAEIDTENFDETTVVNLMKEQIEELIQTNPNSELQSWNIALAANTPGVYNIKNVLINGQVDYSVEGFSVIRIADKDTSITINVLPLSD